MPSFEEYRLYSIPSSEDVVVARNPYLQTYFLKHMRRMQIPFRPPSCMHLHSQLLWFKSFARLINYY